MESRIQNLEKEIEIIKARNLRVEADKAWETSGIRRILLIVFTYTVMGTYMYAIGVKSPLINAIIPTLGFLLSTLTLPFFRKYWEKYK